MGVRERWRWDGGERGRDEKEGEGEKIANEMYRRKEEMGEWKREDYDRIKTKKEGGEEAEKKK